MTQKPLEQAAPLILVVEDEPQIRRVLRHALEPDIGRVLEAETGLAAIDLAASRQPALVVLDLGLPDRTGESVCREIRLWSKAPILVLSARHSDLEKVALLDAGADDYVTKPFSTAELKARVRAHLRRAGGAALPKEILLEVDGLAIDLAARTVARDAQGIHLTPTEWNLLLAFLRHAGRTLTHRQIFDAVWGRAGGDPQSHLRVHVANLRRKIERDPLRPRLIVTESGVGYRFDNAAN